MKLIWTGFILLLLILGIGAIVAINGNQTPHQETNTDNISYREVTLPDGQVIPCLIYARGNKSGLSCAWEVNK